MIKVREPGHRMMLRRKSVTHTVSTMHPARQVVAQAPRPVEPALKAKTDGPVTITGVSK
jgi:hypothetical protein